MESIDFPNICIVGAGFSGIGAAIKLKQELNLTRYTIFEENSDVGGTWMVNTYPGCACDVASHLYSFSFEPNPNWSYVYSPQSEIWNYLKNVAKKYDLYRQITFNHKVTKAIWDEKINKWRILVKNKSTNTESEFIFDVMISCIGGLRVPNIPEEFLSFKGPRIHSAEWNSNINLTNKNVAVVGSGASAVQIISAIANKVKKLMVYQRHPAWVVPRIQFEIPDWLKWIFTNIPGVQQMYRSYIFWSGEIYFPAFQTNSYFNKLGTMLGNYQLNRQLGDKPQLLEKVKPNYEFGCKRVTPSNEYFPSLALPHVEVIRSKITGVKSNAIVTEDGTKKQIDVLILATGFQVQEYFSPLEITVRKGIKLLDLWKKEGPSAYYGICFNAAPNSFLLLGPNSGLGHNSIIFSLECQINWTVQVIREMIQRKSKVVRVKESAEKEYMDQMLKDLKSTVWNTGCGSWYADARGVITALSPYSLVSYWRKTRIPNFNHLDFK